MHNKKIIAKGLIVSILFFNAPTDSIADLVENYSVTVVDKENKFEEFFNNLFEKFKNTKKVEDIEINKNIRVGSVKEITIGNGGYVPNLDGNPDGYETIRIITKGTKKLEKQDYDNLRTSGIPKIDLSNSVSDFIPSSAFYNATHLKEFKFPQGITSIGDGNRNEGAFQGCVNLKGELIIPDSVVEIKRSSFYECKSLTGNLIIPDSVISIEQYAFYGCSGFNGFLKLSNFLTSIEEGVFNGCNGFTGDLIIPNSVTSIKTSSFKNCSGFNGNLILSTKLKSIGQSSFEGCSGFIGSLDIPSSVASIYDSAFYRCSGFTGDLIIPDNITLLSQYTFAGCSGFNGELVISKSITEIEQNTFEGCSGLTGDLIIPNNITSIYGSAFKNCLGFTGSLIIPDSITFMGGYVFEGCSGFNGDLIISKNLKNIGYAAFKGCTGLKGNLIIPDGIISIEGNVFEGCSGLVGDLIIPNSLEEVGEGAFKNINSIERVVIKISEDYANSNYRKDMIRNISNIEKSILDVPYDFDVTDKWMGNTNRIIGKPSIKNIVNGEEIEINSGEIGKKISLNIPVPYSEDDIIVLKDNKPYDLPTINEDKKYIFDEIGTYEVNITTTLGNVSSITFTVENTDYTNIEEAISKAEESRSPEDVEVARDLVNALPESSKKDEFQDRLDAISPNIEFETKNATANLDIYIKSENLLSLSVNTNSVTFEDFSGVEDDEKLNAIMLTVNSSLPYDVKAYLPVEITGSKYGEALDKEIFNIRANGEMDYQTFVDTETPIILLESEDAGSNNNHGIDLKLASDLAFKNDVYKATVKFEVEQK